MISFSHKGDFSKISDWLNKNKELARFDILEHYAQLGVDALRDATPKDTGLTADSWYYKIYVDSKNGTEKITFCNSNVNDGVPIAIILQYGHGTKNGGYVQGIDYINPALKPIFDNIANEIWEGVIK